MKLMNLLFLVVVSIQAASVSAFASGKDKNGPNDLVFQCNRVLSDGQRVYAHILSSEARYDSYIGTYNVKACESAYHSCFTVTDEQGWGFNNSLINLIPTHRPDIVQLSTDARSPLNNAICVRIQ